MNTLMKVMIWTAFGLAGLSLIAAPGDKGAGHRANSPDAIAESFEREFNHSPAQERPPRGESIDVDILYRDINRLSWSHNDQVHRAIKDCAESSKTAPHEGPECTQAMTANQ